MTLNFLTQIFRSPEPKEKLSLLGNSTVLLKGPTKFQTFFCKANYFSFSCSFRSKNSIEGIPMKNANIGSQKDRERGKGNNRKS